MFCENCFTEIRSKKDVVECVSCQAPLHKECANKCLECGAPVCDECMTLHDFKCTKCSTKPATSNEPLVVDVVRRSNIELYKECPYAFYLLVIKGCEVPNNAYAELGILLHEIYDEASLCKIDEVESRIRYDDGFITRMEKHFTSEQKEERNEFYENGLKALHGYWEWEHENPSPFETETTVQFEIASGAPKVQITYDRLQYVNGELELVDYKTGKVYVGTKLISDLQIPLYLHAVKTRHGILPQRFRLVFTREGKERVYEKLDDDTYTCTVRKKVYKISLQDALKEVQSLFARIQNREFSIANSVKEWHCTNRCACYKSELCKGKIEQAWYNVAR